MKVEKQLVSVLRAWSGHPGRGLAFCVNLKLIEVSESGGSDYGRMTWLGQDVLAAFLQLAEISLDPDSHMKAVLATCEYCEGRWTRRTNIPADHLEGVCMECQAESDTEKPLTFKACSADDYPTLDPLPWGWLASDNYP